MVHSDDLLGWNRELITRLRIPIAFRKCVAPYSVFHRFDPL